MSQTLRGKAFEYAVAQAFATHLGVPLDSASSATAKRHYNSCEDSPLFDRAAREATLFLVANDRTFDDAQGVRLQSYQVAQGGDVRDVLVDVRDGRIGISAKNNSDEMRALRLSADIDFGKIWTDCPVSSDYWRAVNPTFNYLKELRGNQARFSDIPNKRDTVYLPILIAFEDEVRRLMESFGARFIRRLYCHVIGTHDFYKVVRKESHVEVWSFNLRGEVNWGQRWRLPERIVHMGRVAGTMARMTFTFDNGSQLAFRLHNARTIAEPSLKFSITFDGLPAVAATHQIPLEPRV